MNLQEIKRILDKFEPDKFALVFNLGNKKFSNLNNFRRLVKAIESIPIARQQIDLLEKSFIFAVSGDEVVHEANDYWTIHAAADELIVMLKGLRELADQMVPVQNNETISIKLPE